MWDSTAERRAQHKSTTVRPGAKYSIKGRRIFSSCDKRRAFGRFAYSAARSCDSSKRATPFNGFPFVSSGSASPDTLPRRERDPDIYPQAQQTIKGRFNILSSDKIKRNDQRSLLYSFLVLQTQCPKLGVWLQNKASDRLF
jgi:hypothetical protein